MWRILATGMFGLLVCNSSIFAASTRASDDDGGARFPYAANRARLSEPNVRFSQASGPGGNSPTNQVVTPTSSITVTAATYGGNCGVQAGNMTAVLAKACNGRDRCDYRIDYKIIGDPARGCHKDFIAAWQCSGDQASHTARVAPEAGFGSVITASCGSRPVLVPSSGATVLKNLEAQQTQQRQAECQIWCYPRSSRVRRLRWRSGLGHGRLHRGDMHRRCRVGQCPKYLRCVRLYVRSGRTVRFADKLVHRGKRAYFRYDVPTRISSAAVRQSLCHP